MGLMLGVEHMDVVTGEPDTATTGLVFGLLRECGVLIGGKGRDGNVFRIKPPMCISKEDVDYAVAAMDLCYEEAARRLLVAAA